MEYTNTHIAEVAQILRARFAELQNKAEILKAVELRALYAEIPTIAPEQRGSFGKEINALKQELEQLVASHQQQAAALPAIDVTAPFDSNVGVDNHPTLLTSDQGSQHPLMTELKIVLDIFYRMGFTAVESREIDDDYHMFEALNFPEGHPARDDYDTFMTVQKDKKGKPLIAPGLVKIQCEVHPWMTGYIVVTDHPYFAVTDLYGEYELSEVPPGTYQLKLWHESLGVQEKRIEIKAGGAQVVDFSFTPSAGVKK